jgi:hypothetical protein
MWDWLSSSSEVKINEEKKTDIAEFSFLRNCSNPTAQYGGIYCIGSEIDTILCNVSNVTCPSK